jgi:hypothetical protein
MKFTFRHKLRISSVRAVNLDTLRVELVAVIEMVSGSPLN